MPKNQVITPYIVGIRMEAYGLQKWGTEKKKLVYNLCIVTSDTGQQLSATTAQSIDVAPIALPSILNPGMDSDLAPGLDPDPDPNPEP